MASNDFGDPNPSDYCSFSESALGRLDMAGGKSGQNGRDLVEILFRI